jgi:hypothetical protein
MKYFTPEWWAMEVESPEAVVTDYHLYIASIRSRLSPSLLSLHEEVSLHDSVVRGFMADLKIDTVLITLEGWTNPWSPDGKTGRRFNLRYEGVTAIENTNMGGWVSELLDNSDLGYSEIELLSEDLWEHRMLFASGIELKIRFEKFGLKYEPFDWVPRNQ